MSSMAFKLHSHPDVLLKDHLEQVLHTGVSTFQGNAVFSEYEGLLKVILAFHDIGKSSAHFQNYLLNQEPRSNLSRHSEISALWACYYCLKVLDLGVLDAIFAYVCISSHHRSLANFNEMLCPSLSIDELVQISRSMDYDELNSILDHFGMTANLSEDLFHEVIDYFAKNSLSILFRKQKTSLGQESWLLLDYLFSLLIWADKYSAIFKREARDNSDHQWQPEYLDNFKLSFVNSDHAIDCIRNEAYDLMPQALHPEVKLYSINLPTGAGKTISSLKVAMELRSKNPDLKRVIYCLPFTSVIDQNHNVFTQILNYNGINPDSNLLLAHHHLAEFDYKGETEYSRNESEYLVETWDSELVVSTFVQLLASFLSVRNSNLKRFHRLANAIIILDEVQNIPHHYWPLLNHTLKLLCQYLNSVVILVTATLPMIFEANDPELLELAQKKQVWFTTLNRIELFHTKLDHCISLQDLVDLITNDHEQDPKQKRLIILNTVQSSLDLYEYLGRAIPDAELIYLSSNVVPKHRLDRINRIKTHSGKALIIVSTQVVEAGVDIDVDVVYRDLAPLDSIIQASGRCNRNASKDRSKVVIFQLAKENRPYWKYIYDETLVMGTLRVLSTMENPIVESDLLSLSQRYYALLSTVSSQDRSRRIISNMSRLDLETALSYHPKENPDAFNLIESHPAQTAFVECDSLSSELYARYLLVRNSTQQNNFEKRAELKDLFRKMGAYMINVDKRFIETEDQIFFIDRDSLNLYYDPNTGFKRKQNQADYIF